MGVKFSLDYVKDLESKVSMSRFSSARKVFVSISYIIWWSIKYFSQTENILWHSAVMQLVDFAFRHIWTS